MTNDETCDYGNCTDEPTTHSRTGSYCHADHSIAASNDWPPEEMAEYAVEYDGQEGTYRAPSQEQASEHYRHYVLARR